MNLILAFLNENRERLRLDRHGATGTLSLLMLTPNVYTASHVEFLIMAEHRSVPVLTAKIPRTLDNSAALQREADNLRLIQAMHRTNAPQLPDVIAFESYRDVPILVQKAISGKPIGPSTASHVLQQCCQRMSRWLVELQQFQQIQRSATAPEPPSINRFTELVETPIRYFTKYFPISEHEVRLLVRTWDLVDPLRQLPLPVVFAHRNLGKQNVKLLNDNNVGVVNWELAEPYGLPGCDLFRLLATSAVSLNKATTRSAYMATIQQAFFDRNGWARPHITDYAKSLHLSHEFLTALFTLTWLQGTVNHLMRLDTPATHHADNAPPHQARECTPETARWLRKQPDFVLWEYAVEHAHDFSW
jgi:hypothetical protein